MQKDAAYWIQHLQLIPHPEGGYFRETYRAPEMLTKESLPARYSADRVFATAIYFLLADQQVSKFHRLQSDELWLYHDGSALTLYVIETDGNLHTMFLGKDVDKGERPQIIIQRGVWFGAKVNQLNSYTLVSCVVAPGFEFADFALASRAQLMAEYPQHSEIISLLT
jgi:predicted cupin superfamily sugar epimerase